MKISGVDVAREFIRFQMKGLGMNAKDFGAHVGIADSSISDMLSGKRRVHFVHLDKIAKALNMEWSAVLDVMTRLAEDLEED